MYRMPGYSNCVVGGGLPRSLPACEVAKDGNQIVHLTSSPTLPKSYAFWQEYCKNRKDWLEQNPYPSTEENVEI